MPELDPVIHAPLRLRLCSVLSAVDAVEFSNLRDRLNVADSVLSKHVSTLVDAGYATSRKESLDGRRTTWIALTRQGRAALRKHLAALQALIDDAQVSAT
jgi:DNA-binding MarR family transcriptional regulator